MAKTPTETFDPYGPLSSGVSPDLMNAAPVSSGGGGDVIAQMQALAQTLSQQFTQQQRAPTPRGPTVAADPTGKQLFINGKVVDSNDYNAILQSEGLLQQPGDGRVPAGWNKVPPATVAAFIQNIKNPGFGELFWKNVQQASYGMGELAGGAIAALSPEGSAAESAGLGLYGASKKESERYAPYQREFGSSPLGEFIPSALGQAVPSMATGLALGGVGGLAGRAVAGPLARAGMAGAARLAPAVGAYTGAMAAGTGMGYGDYAQEDIEAGRTPRGSSYGLGPLAYGAIEYAPEALIAAGALGKLGRAMPFGRTPGLKGRALRAGTMAAVGGLGEGAEEVAQEEMLIRYHDTWEAGYANSPEAAHRRVQSAAGGAVPGILMGGMGGAISSQRKPTPLDLNIGGGPSAPELDVGGGQTAPELDVGGGQTAVDVDTGLPPIGMDIGGGPTPVGMDIGTAPIPMGGPKYGDVSPIPRLPAPTAAGVVSPNVGASPLIPGAEAIRLPPGFEITQTTPEIAPVVEDTGQIELPLKQRLRGKPATVIEHITPPMAPQGMNTLRQGMVKSASVSPGAMPLIPGPEPSFAPAGRTLSQVAQEAVAPEAVPKGQKALGLRARKAQPNAAPAPTQTPAPIIPPIKGVVEPVAAPIQAVQPIQEAPSAQGIRSNARQILKRGTQGQPTVQRGPDQGGENIQLPAQAAPGNAQAQQQTGQVVPTRAPKVIRKKAVPITGEEEPDEPKPRKRLAKKTEAEVTPTKTITPTVTERVEEGVVVKEIPFVEPTRSIKKGGFKTEAAKAAKPLTEPKKRKAPQKTFERAPASERTEYALDAIDKAMGEDAATNPDVVKLANLLDELFVGKQKDDLNKDVAVNRVIDRLAAAYHNGLKETKQAVEGIGKYYKHLTDEQVDRIRGVSGGTSQTGGKPRYSTGATATRVGHWSVEDARRVIHHIVGRLKRAPKRVVVFNDYVDIPQWLEDEARLQDAADGGTYLNGLTFAQRLAADAKAGRGAMAVSLPDTIVFFSGYLPAARSAVHLIAAHEMLGHHGFRNILTEDIRQQVFTSIAQNNARVNATAAGIYDAIRRSRPELNLPINFADALTSPTRSRAAEYAADAVEEVLSDQAAILDARLLNRLWDKVKQALNFFGVRFDDDAMRYWIRQARAYVRDGIKVNDISVGAISNRVHYAISDPETLGWKQTPELLMEEQLRFGSLNGAAARDDMTANVLADVRWGRYYSGDPDIPGAINRIWNHSKNIVASGALRTWRDFLSSVIRTTTDVLNASPNGRKLIRYLRNQHAEVTRLISKYTQMLDPATRDLKKDQLVITGNIVHFNTLLKGRKVTLADYDDVELFREIGGSWEVDPEGLRKLMDLGRPRIDEINKTMVVPVLLPRGITTEDKAKIAEKWDKKLAIAEKKANAAIEKAQTEEEKKRHRDQLEASVETLERQKKEALAETQVWVWQDKMDLSFSDHDKMTADSKEFQAATKIYETITEAAVDQAFSKMVGAKVFADEIYARNVNRAIGESLDNLSKQELALFRKVAKQYAKMMDAEKTYDEDTGRLGWDDDSAAKFFLKNFIGSLKGNTGTMATFLKEFDGTTAETEQLFKDFYQKYKKREDQLGDIETALREQYMTTAMMEEAQLYAKKTIATGYAPLSRFGRFEVKMQGYTKDEKGEFTKPYKLDEGSPFQALLAYMRFESEGEADYFRTTWEKSFFERRSYIVEGDEVQFRPEVGYVSQNSPAADRVSLFDFIEAAQRLGVRLPPAAIERATKALTRADAAVRHQMLRGGNPGWSKDIMRSVNEHVDRSAHLSGANVFRPLIDKILFDERGWFISDQEIAEARKNYADAVELHGKDSPATWLAKRDLDTTLHFREMTKREGKYYKDFGIQLIHWYQNRGGTFKESEHPAFSAIRNVVSTAQLGGSLAQVPIQMMSLVTHTLPTLASYNPNTGFGYGDTSAGAFKSYAQAAALMFKTTRDVSLVDAFKHDIGRVDRLQEAIKEGKLNHLTQLEREYLLRATREGHLQAAQYNALVGSARGIKNTKTRRFIADTWMRPYTWAEETNRRITGLSAYRMAFERYRAAGLNEKEAFTKSYQESVDAINNSQGDYAMYARPKWARSGLGSVLFMYKMFMVTTVQLLKNLGPAGRMEMLTLLFLLGGLKGLPFWEDILDVFDTAAQKLGFKSRPAEFAIRKGLDSTIGATAGRIAMSGWLEMMTGGSWSPRVGVGDIIPGTSLFKAGAETGRELETLIGPFAGFARGTAGFINRLALTGDISTDTIRQIPISGVKNIADAWRYHRDGAIRDGRGYLIAPDAGANEVIMRALGFYPTAATYQYDMVRLLRQTTEYTRQVKAVYVQEAVAAKLQNDPVAYQEVLDTVAAWNEGAPDELLIKGFGTSVGRAVQEANRPLIQRTLKNAPKGVQRNEEQWLTLFGFAPQ